MTAALGACSDWPRSEGELWTRARLARLRDCGWRPRALLDFLWAAQTRANLTRRQRPALARQEARWILGGAAGWLVLARLLPRSQIARARDRGLVWWAGCGVMLDWHLGMLETPEGRAVRLGAADALTLMRAWLVPAIADRAEPTLLLLGALSDLARRAGSAGDAVHSARARPGGRGRRVLFLGRAARRGSRRPALPGPGGSGADASVGRRHVLSDRVFCRGASTRPRCAPQRAGRGARSPGRASRRQPRAARPRRPSAAHRHADRHGLRTATPPGSPRAVAAIGLG